MLLSIFYFIFLFVFYDFCVEQLKYGSCHCLDWLTIFTDKNNKKNPAWQSEVSLFMNNTVNFILFSSTFINEPASEAQNKLIFWYNQNETLGFPKPIQNDSILNEVDKNFKLVVSIPGWWQPRSRALRYFILLSIVQMLARAFLQFSSRKGLFSRLKLQLYSQEIGIPTCDQGLGMWMVSSTILSSTALIYIVKLADFGRFFAKISQNRSSAKLKSYKSFEHLGDHFCICQPCNCWKPGALRKSRHGESISASPTFNNRTSKPGC